MVDDPSVEDGGGFEFASGMDMFSEPEVMKASLALEEVSYGVGAFRRQRSALGRRHRRLDEQDVLVAGDKILCPRTACSSASS